MIRIAVQYFEFSGNIVFVLPCIQFELKDDLYVMSADGTAGDRDSEEYRDAVFDAWKYHAP